MPDLTHFHLLRPQWLWALLPVAAVALALARQADASARWEKVVAPHLLEHLVVKPDGGWRPRPCLVLAVYLVVLAVAAAGPSWRREPPPFSEDTAPLVLAVDLSPSMLVEDVRPSRLDRARHKVIDLLAAREGAKTALVAYAGTAHRVLPLTDDPGLVAGFVADLSPSIMPVEGKDPVAALSLAEEMLSGEATPGTILFLADGIPASAAPDFAAHAGRSRDQVVVLAVGTEGGGAIPGSRSISALDRVGLETVAREAGATVIGITLDDSDVQRIMRRIDTHLAAVQQEDVEGRWRDEGWWLVWPAAALGLLWFRRGWLVQWEG